MTALPESAALAVPAIRYNVLGPVTVERDGVAVAIGGPQQCRLLGAMLVNRGRVVSVDRLVEVLWPGAAVPPGAARSTMTYVSRLRAALGDGAIVTVGAGYRLDQSGATCDVDEFEALVAAAERSLPDRAVDLYGSALVLWRDEPFGELAVEWWALAEVARLGEQRALAREQRAAALIAVGHHSRAVPDLEALAIDEPHRERCVELLMQALHATGRTAEALRQFRTFRTRLGEDTGLVPSSTLVALERWISGAADRGDDASIDRPLRGYVLHEAIGEGAFGRVYAATQPGTGRRVAVKAIRPDVADTAEFIRRFDAEAQLVARLEHPHVVPLYDYWREPGGAYLVFRLLTGGTAYDAVVSGGPWSIPRVSRLVAEVGGALMVAHAEGIIHRDVKAANVLLDADGAAYLSDFGIATRDAGADVLGDVRGFGWLLWHLLSGSPPPAISERCPSLVGRVAAVPSGLDAVLGKATAADGYTSIAEVVLGWRAAVVDHGETAPSESSDERLAVDSARRQAAQHLARSETAGINPYRGLRPFDEADAARFFGRSAAVDDLAALVRHHRMVAVVGASGSGKSSVARAGLVPHLRASGATVITIVPGDDPGAALHGGLTEVASTPLPTNDLGAAIEVVASQLGDLVIVVDQFEECWTRVGADSRQAFIEPIAGAVEDTGAPVRVVATIRADLLDRPLQHPRIGEAVSAGTYVLGPMSPAELDDAIVLPAAAAGVYLDDAVVAHLVAEATAQPGALPLLQFTLAELYDRRCDGRITEDARVAVGGVTGAVGRRAEELYSTLGDAERAGARELFARLVIPGERGPDTRQRARLSELSPAARSVATKFVDVRLLVTDRDQSSREPTIEVAHEALLARWDRLAGWIADDRRWLVQLQQLAGAARAWDDGGRLPGDLYRGSRLEAAIESVAGDGRTVSDLEREYLDAGRAARDADVVAARRTARRLRGLLTAVGIALVLTLTLGAVAFVQRRRADEAATDALAAVRTASIEALVGRAEAARSTQRDTAALLAVEAYRLADTPRTRSALFGTFTNDIGFLDAHRFDQEFGPAGIVFPDGENAVVVLDDGRVRRYDLDTGALGEPWPLPGSRADPYPAMAVSADGRRLAHLPWIDGAGTDFVVGIFDVATTELTTGPEPIAGQVFSVTFSADGESLVAGVDFNGDGTSPGLVLIDASTGEQLATMDLPDAPERVVDFITPATYAMPAATPLPDGGFAVGSDAGTVFLLDGHLSVVRTVELPPFTTTSLQPLSDGTIVGSGVDGVVRFDPRSGEHLWQQLDYGEACANLRVIEEAGSVFCGSWLGALTRLDLATGVVTRELIAQNGGGGTLWVARDGTELVSFGGNEAVIARWRLDGSGPITTLGPPGWGTWFLSPDGRHLIAAHTDRPGKTQDPLALTFRVFDAENGDVVTSLDGLLKSAWADDDTVAGGVMTDDGLRIGHVALATGDMTLHGDTIGQVPDYATFVPGKSRLLLGYIDDDGSATVWPLDVATGLRTEPTIEVDDLAWADISPSGHRILLGSPSGVTIFDGSSGEALGTVSNSSQRGGFITVADQLFLVSTGGELTHYDLDSLEPIRTFDGSLGFIQGINGTADGSLILTRGGEGWANLYDVASGIRLGAPIPIPVEDEFQTASIALDGSRMAIGGGIENGYQIWDLDPDHWVEGACRLAGRNLTRQEWATNIGELAEYRPTCPQFPFQT
jgi:DNA-binding SARP family transcriptional activator/WD40 repeat protein